MLSSNHENNCQAYFLMYYEPPSMHSLASKANFLNKKTKLNFQTLGIHGEPPSMHSSASKAKTKLNLLTLGIHGTKSKNTDQLSSINYIHAD